MLEIKKYLEKFCESFINFLNLQYENNWSKSKFKYKIVSLFINN